MLDPMNTLTVDESAKTVTLTMDYSLAAVVASAAGIMISMASLRNEGTKEQEISLSILANMVAAMIEDNYSPEDQVGIIDLFLGIPDEITMYSGKTISKLGVALHPDGSVSEFDGGHDTAHDSNDLKGFLGEA